MGIINLLQAVDSYGERAYELLDAAIDSANVLRILCRSLKQVDEHSAVKTKVDETSAKSRKTDSRVVEIISALSVPLHLGKVSY